jgi:glutamine amidotransferase
VIGIIDYGLGNVLAFQNVYRRLNIPAEVVRTSEDVLRASKLILPGVGAFDHAMDLFGGTGLRPVVEEAVRQRGVPVLGVCVGMQILGASSEEGAGPGLGWVPGAVRRLPAGPDGPLQLPHMGWNDVEPSGDSRLFEGLERDCRFYFLHSYYFAAEADRYVIASAFYGRPFCCAVRAGNVYGVQFHPEKSHHYGAQLLKNFAEFG